MESQILASLSGITAFAKYFFGSLALLFIFSSVYMFFTPYNELKMIRDKGMTAPAISLGGAILGFSLPMASAIAHSVGFLDMVIWSAIAMLVQLFVFLVIRIIFPKLIKDITEDKNGAAIAIAAFSIAAGILNAASMTY
jgi:putative membrane protein